MDQEPKIDKYAKAKIEDPNPQFPKSLLMPGSDPTSSLKYSEIYEEDNQRAKHLAEEIAAGAQLCRKVYRIRIIDLVKVLGVDFKGMLPIHRASKATIGLLADDEAVEHTHSYIDLVGTVEQVKMAEELILDKVLKAYSSDCYPVILMPPTVHEYEMKITLDKVSSVIDLFRANILRLEMISGAWITLSPPPPPGVIEQERVAKIYGPRENVIQAVSLIRSAMSQPMESFEGGSDFKEPSCGEPSGSGVNKGSEQLEESISGTGQMEGGSSTERDRKGKAKVVESDDAPPASTPKIRIFTVNDHHYLRVIGELPVGPNFIEGVTRVLLRIRVKDVPKILGNQDLMFMSIHRASGATIGIFNDTIARFHFHAYVELLGTADQIRIAALLITDAITEIPLDDASFVPPAIMPLDICHKSMNIPFLKVASLLGIDGTNLRRMEAESGAWIDLDIDVPPVDQEACESTVNIYGSKQQVMNAMEMIIAIVYEGHVLPANEEEFGIEEIGYNEQGEKQDTVHKDSAVTNNEEVEGEQSVKEGEQKECVASGSGTQKKSVKKPRKKKTKKNKSVKEDEQNEFVEKDGSGGETAHNDSAVTKIPLDDVPTVPTATTPSDDVPSVPTAIPPSDDVPSVATATMPSDDVPSVPTAITPSDDVSSVPTAITPSDDVPSVPTDTTPLDDVSSVPTPSWDRTDSYVSDGDNVEEERLDPPGLIALRGCSISEAYQFLNNRWEAVMRAYEDPSTDLSERPVMYSGSGETEVEGSSHQFDFLSELRRVMNQ